MTVPYRGRRITVNTPGFEPENEDSTSSGRAPLPNKSGGSMNELPKQILLVLSHVVATFLYILINAALAIPVFHVLQMYTPVSYDSVLLITLLSGAIIAAASSANSTT